MVSDRLGWLPFDIPYITPKIEGDLMNRMIERLTEIESVESTFALGFEAQARETSAKPFDLEAIRSALPENDANRTQFTDDFEAGFKSIPGDISLLLEATGFTERPKADKPIDLEASLSGRYQSGGATFEGEINLRKVGEVVYVNIPMFPLLLDVSAIEDKWVAITKSDLTDSEYGSYIGLFTGNSQGNLPTSQQIVGQLKVILSAAQSEKFIEIDKSLGQQKIDGINAEGFRLKMDPAKAAAFYRKVADNLSSEFGSQAVIKFDQSTADSLAKPDIQEFLNQLVDSATFDLWVDPANAWPVKFDYRLRLVPPDSNEKLKDKQFLLTLSMTFKKINSGQSVAKPGNTIDLDEAVRLITGVSKEEQDFGKQTRRITDLQTALGRYYNSRNTYPNQLNDLQPALKEIANECQSGFQNANTSSTGFGLEDISCNMIQSYADQTELSKDVYTDKTFGYTKDGADFKVTYEIRYFDGMSDYDKTLYVDGQNTMTSKLRSVDADAIKNMNSNTNLNTNANVNSSTNTNSFITGLPDSDNDGLTDHEESYYNTDPANPDSDGDGYLDSEEVQNGYNPLGSGKLT